MKGSLCRLAETSFLWRDTAMRIRERFNPRAPCGARRRFRSNKSRYYAFQPTRPLRGATVFRSSMAGSPSVHFNPRAPCGARPQCVESTTTCWHFNPRAPCGARHYGLVRRYVFYHFNPRAPCGARPVRINPSFDNSRFQPTRPLRGATVGQGGIPSPSPYFNPRAPCGARLLRLLKT